MLPLRAICRFCCRYWSATRIIARDFCHREKVELTGSRADAHLPPFCSCHPKHFHEMAISALVVAELDLARVCARLGKLGFVNTMSSSSLDTIKGASRQHLLLVAFKALIRASFTCCFPHISVPLGIGISCYFTAHSGFFKSCSPLLQRMSVFLRSRHSGVIPLIPNRGRTVNVRHSSREVLH